MGKWPRPAEAQRRKLRYTQHNTTPSSDEVRRFITHGFINAFLSPAPLFCIEAPVLSPNSVRVFVIRTGPFLHFFFVEDTTKVYHLVYGIYNK
jgi:hypothetical protein